MKKYLYIILCIFIISILIQGCSTKKDAVIINEPGKASEVLLSSFEPNGNGDYIYPDDYAGEWIDGEYLYIALTDTSKSSMRKYKRILDGYDNIKFVEADYSLNHLNIVRDAAAMFLIDRFTISSYGVDLKQNRIVFGVVDANLIDVQSAIDDETKSLTPFGLDESIGASSAMFVVVDGEIITNEAESNEEFTALISKHIIEADIKTPMYGKLVVDLLWLEQEFSESEICEKPENFVILDFDIEINYEDGTQSVLRLMNEFDGVCSIEYNSISYYFKNDTITKWLLGTIEGDNTIPLEEVPVDITDSFSVLTNKQIAKVRIGLPTGEVETGIDIEWLENQLKFCQEGQMPDESDKKDIPIDIYYEDNTVGELFIYNLDRAYFMIRYDDKDIYYFRNEVLAQWLMDLKEEKEDEQSSHMNFAVHNDVYYYTKGMTFPIVNCTQRENDIEIIEMYLSVVFNNSSEYEENNEDGVTFYNSLEDDGRYVEVIPSSRINMKLLYSEDGVRISSYFSKALEHANSMIESLRYDGKVDLFFVDGAAVGKERSSETIYAVEYIYSMKINDLYFSCLPGGNSISVTCNNLCAFEVDDAIAENFENIGKAVINYDYEGAVKIIEDYEYSESDILYCAFVYSHVFSDDKTVYRPVWEVGFEQTYIQVDAESGELYDYCQTRSGS